MIDDRKAERLAEGSSLVNLVELDVSNNDTLTDVGAVALIRSKRLARLERLGLRSTQVGTATVEALCESDRFLRCGELQLWKCALNDRSLEPLAASPHAALLRSFTSGSVGYTDRGAKTLAAEFKQRSSAHVAHDVGHVRALITKLEAELDVSAARITQRMAGKEADRAALFLILKSEVADGEGRGARILDAAGLPIAWWGEDYRAPADRIFQFDVTNLYVTRSRKVKQFTVQSFERIESARHVIIEVNGRPIAEFCIWVCRGLKHFPPPPDDGPH
jgi:hypothetical protein